MRKIEMVLCSVLVATTVLSGCGNTGAVEKTDESGTHAAETTAEATAGSEVLKPEENGREKVVPQVQTDLKPSEGLMFEHDEDGTCVLTGIGICTDTELVV